MLRRQIIYAYVEITIALCYAVLVLNSDATKGILCRAVPCGTHGNRTIATLILHIKVHGQRKLH